MLPVIAGESVTDARAAVLALSPRRYDPGVRERARGAAARNERVDLRDELEKAFGAE